MKLQNIEGNSPCIGVCVLLENYCVGCGRSLKEISTWTSLTDSEQKEVLERIINDKTSSI
jgi:predicted Fe-S protein YdhL (DUF1289 family)|tara:strand:+ start:102 stop:281 length:180 start_codon:yes stop_codon:yes gene_type:complete